MATEEGRRRDGELQQRRDGGWLGEDGYEDGGVVEAEEEPEEVRRMTAEEVWDGGEGGTEDDCGGGEGRIVA
jgi:hypothetical protein